MRNLPLDRTTGECLVNLLEDCDPEKDGTWRHDLAADVRHIFGMVPFKRDSWPHDEPEFPKHRTGL